MNKQNTNIEALLQGLPDAANAAMGGLTATPFMKAKIDRAVAQQQAAGKRRIALPRWATAAASAALVLALALTSLPLLQQEPATPSLISSSTLGEPTELPAGTLTADLGNGDVSISANRSQPSYRSIWSKVTDGSFPLIGVNGKYYRMLTSPRSVDEGLIGTSLGSVAEYTTEPSLSGTDAVLSNTVPFGGAVHAIRGMEGTLVTAQVNGAWRLFQRVSYNGHALRGSEKLADTLQLRGHVIAMELSGVGTITDAAACEELLNTLLRCATYESSGSISNKQALLIELDNGLVVQLAVRGDKLAACGVWSCPEFLEAFEAACN